MISCKKYTIRLLFFIFFILLTYNSKACLRATPNPRLLRPALAQTGQSPTAKAFGDEPLNIYRL
jgi:hypothetical protein